MPDEDKTFGGFLYSISFGFQNMMTSRDNDLLNFLGPVQRSDCYGGLKRREIYSEYRRGEGRRRIQNIFSFPPVLIRNVVTSSFPIESLLNDFNLCLWTSKNQAFIYAVRNNNNEILIILQVQRFELIHTYQNVLQL